MTPDQKQKLIEKLIVETKKLAEPVDFEDLEKKGALVKEGVWYRVLDSRKLPEHVWVKMYGIAQDSKGVKVKIYKTTTFDKLARKFEKFANKTT
jgi:hypothetical protein